MSYKRLTFLAPLMVFALLLLQITPGDAKKCDIWNRDVDESGSNGCKPPKCEFWLRGLSNFRADWADAKDTIVGYPAFDSDKRRKVYQAAKPKLDRCMNGYGCAHLGSCRDYWESFKKAVEGNYYTFEYFDNFMRSCDQKVAHLLSCSKSYFDAGICDNCKCKD